MTEYKLSFLGPLIAQSTVERRRKMNEKVRSYRLDYLQRTVYDDAWHCDMVFRQRKRPTMIALERILHERVAALAVGKTRIKTDAATKRRQTNN